MFTASAPGKTILFGEHAVVYGVPAIAASVSLRTYCTCEEIHPNSTDSTKLVLDLPDLGGTYTVFQNDLEKLISGVNLPKYATAEVPTSLDPILLEKSTELATAIAGPQLFAKSALLAFLYLYASIFSQHVGEKAFKFSVRSALPLGAGLGSSASLSVSVAAALLRASGIITTGGVVSSTTTTTTTTTAATTPRETILDLTNKWSFLGECCIHGNPSGIDNLVATRGGAVYFQRRPNQPPIVKTYSNLPEINLLLTDTTVPRSTSDLVARVRATKDKWPALFDNLLSGFSQLVVEADALLKDPHSPEFLINMCQLIEINHGLLVTISVSHPALERVKESSFDMQLGATKLTGAGGGGCAITVCNSLIDSATLKSFQAKLGPQFKVFSTELGGAGVGYADAIANSIDDLKKLKWEY